MTKTCAIVVSYNGAVDTELCLRSLHASFVPVCAVVVDTTPNDPRLPDVVAQFPEVHLLRASANVGFGRGNNLGIRWALANTSCSFILLLNNDAMVLPNSIGELESILDQTPEISIAAPRIVYRDWPDKLWYGGGDFDWRRASAFTPGFNGPAEGADAMRARYVTFASGCAIFVRRDAMLSIGGFDPRFFMYEEDVEWCLRAIRKGYRILYQPNSLILHRAQGGSKTDAEEDRSDFWSTSNPRLTFYAFHIIRNRLLNVFAYANARQKLIVAVFFPLYMLRRAIPFLLGGRMDAVAGMLRGVVDAWRHRRPVAADPMI